MTRCVAPALVAAVSLLCAVLVAGSVGAATGVATKPQAPKAMAVRRLLTVMSEEYSEASSEDMSSEGSTELSSIEESSFTEESSDSSSTEVSEYSSAESSTTTGAVPKFDIVRLLTTLPRNFQQRKLLSEDDYAQQETSSTSEFSEASIELSSIEESSSAEESSESSSTEVSEHSTAESSTSTGAVPNFDIVRLLTTLPKNSQMRKLMAAEESSEASTEVSYLEESSDAEASTEDSSAEESSDMSEESSTTNTGA